MVPGRFGLGAFSWAKAPVVPSAAASVISGITFSVNFMGKNLSLDRLHARGQTGEK